eukprot:CAMPEP_0180695386 /NCGR_PEP_ID=MMETSP1038_2-20121128/2417_1 /TAXON_ID=632150 /ORGANISM="Azadinium spinosum, Strain 3D9" /LENGTH=172 /DNA_ID=CAMNT_0022726793 /DNA_START=270 /DNA_END=784 /DNA_ORIENTATION=-
MSSALPGASSVPSSSCVSCMVALGASSPGLRLKTVMLSMPLTEGPSSLRKATHLRAVEMVLPFVNEGELQRGLPNEIVPGKPVSAIDLELDEGRLELFLIELNGWPYASLIPRHQRELTLVGFGLVGRAATLDGYEGVARVPILCLKTSSVEDSEADHEGLHGPSRLAGAPA